MEDNKLKDEIIAITGNVFPKDSIVYKELYSLTADIAVKYLNWFVNLEGEELEKAKAAMEKNNTLHNSMALFTYFITHIYQPR